MNEKQRERPENINHGATYGNRRLSIPSHSVIKGGREGSEEEGKRIRRRGKKGKDKTKESKKRRGS